MVRLFCRISIPELRRHLLRYFLTVLGIALGVAVFTAIRSANTSLKMSLRDTIDQIAGKAVLQITAGNTGLPEPVLDDVRSVSGIRAAVPIVEAVVHTTDTSQGNLLILGVDMAGDRSMRDYEMEGNEDVISDPLVFLAQPDSILISREFASRNDLREDSRVNLVTGAGNKVFTVRGIMTPKGMAKAFGGNVAVMASIPRNSFSAAAKDSTVSMLR
jgi:putative ABC transport system permease protein